LKKWELLFNKDIKEWLLEDENPSVKYQTLVNLLDRQESDPEVLDAKKKIMKVGLVPKILDKQNREGCWDEADKFYTAKYTGTVWQLIILAELGADKTDDRLKRACEFIFSRSQDKTGGGFSMQFSKKAGCGNPNQVIPCLTGNMVFSLIKMGYHDDERIKKAISWITTYQRFDDGESKPPDNPFYNRFEICFGKHSCHMGVVKALKALSIIPEKNRTAEVNDTIRKGLDYLLKHHLYKKSHNLEQVSKPGWLRLGFPHMYQTDVLEILEIISRLECRDRRLDDAVNHVILKADKNGVWLLENTFNGKYHTNIEQKGKASKWITMKALLTLKNSGI